MFIYTDASVNGRISSTRLDEAKNVSAEFKTSVKYDFSWPEGNFALFPRAKRSYLKLFTFLLSKYSNMTQRLVTGVIFFLTGVIFFLFFC